MIQSLSLYTGTGLECRVAQLLGNQCSAERDVVHLLRRPARAGAANTTASARAGRGNLLSGEVTEWSLTLLLNFRLSTSGRSRMNDDFDNLSLFIQLTIGLVHVNALGRKIARVELVHDRGPTRKVDKFSALIPKQRL